MKRYSTLIGFFIACLLSLGVKHASAQEVSVPVIPIVLQFAGEAVPLNFPDVRCSLERELAVTMYSHSRTLQTLRNTKRYFAIIEPILKKFGIPDDFKYLCMAESGLNPEAVSGAKAGGLWQIMPGTAKEYKLEITSGIDMRYSLVQSTAAACAYLRDAYNKLGNWTLAAAAYNVGMNGVARRMASQGVNNYYDLFLPDETLRYIHRILAFKVLVANPQLYGFQLRDIDYLQPFDNYDVLEVSGQDIDWATLARQHGTTYKSFRLLNPWIRDYTFKNEADKVYDIWMPNAQFRAKGF